MRAEVTDRAADAWSAYEGVNAKLWQIQMEHAARPAFFAFRQAKTTAHEAKTTQSEPCSFAWIISNKKEQHQTLNMKVHSRPSCLFDIRGNALPTLALAPCSSTRVCVLSPCGVSLALLQRLRARESSCIVLSAACVVVLIICPGACKELVRSL